MPPTFTHWPAVCPRHVTLSLLVLASCLTCGVNGDRDYRVIVRLKEHHIKTLRIESVTQGAQHMCLSLLLFFIIQYMTCGRVLSSTRKGLMNLQDGCVLCMVPRTCCLGGCSLPLWFTKFQLRWDVMFLIRQLPALWANNDFRKAFWWCRMTALMFCSCS